MTNAEVSTAYKQALREDYAGRALQGLLANPEILNDEQLEIATGTVFVVSLVRSAEQFGRLLADLVLEEEKA